MNLHMKKIFTLLALLSCFSAAFSLQDTLQAEYASVPESYRQLLLGNDTISYNDKLNEEILDMVEASERDNYMRANYTTHQSYLLNWVIRILGYRWDVVDHYRHKMVGTNKHLPSLPEHDQLTEHDINFDLLPHTKKYTDFMMMGTEARMKRKKALEYDGQFNKPPFIYPTDSTLEQYRVHCELTPPRAFRQEITDKFYPCLPGINIDKHQNFCETKVTFGMFGPYVLDCNHHCHVEIHPYEWLWWLNLHADTTKTPREAKTWMIGFSREGSNRFIKWSKRPRVGTISIPFIFKRSSGMGSIHFEHLVYGMFMPHGLKRMKTLPEQMNNFSFLGKNVKVQLPDGTFFPIRLSSNQALSTKGLKWWIDELQTDTKSEYVWGTLHLAASIHDVYDCKVVINDR